MSMKCTFSWKDFLTSIFIFLQTFSPRFPFFTSWISWSNFFSICPKDPVPKVVKNKVKNDVWLMIFYLISVMFPVPHFSLSHVRSLFIPRDLYFMRRLFNFWRTLLQFCTSSANFCFFEARLRLRIESRFSTSSCSSFIAVWRDITIHLGEISICHWAEASRSPVPDSYLHARPLRIHHQLLCLPVHAHQLLSAGLH